MEWRITGDIHQRELDRFYYLDPNTQYNIIVLGDFCFDYLLDERDAQAKDSLARKFPNITWYVVRGNHEARPADVEGMEIVHDPVVVNRVYRHPAHPHINYLMDGATYLFDKYMALIIGGAYSVDKFYRQMTGRAWFANEQLNEEEKAQIMSLVSTMPKVDFIFTHTCPFYWQPFDLFLKGLDQSTVDNSTEWFLEEIARIANYDTWCFGHFHADRQQGEKGLMLYHKVITLDEAFERKI